MKIVNNHKDETRFKNRKLTEAGVLCKKLSELVTVVFVVATVGAVAVRGDADFGGAQVVGGHHGACSRWIQGFIEVLEFSKKCDLTHSLCLKLCLE